MPNPLQELENNSVISKDFYVGEVIQGVLSGHITKNELRKELSRRKKETIRTVNGIDKLMEFF